ncbi:MAG: nitroreductase family protein [Lautropia sp.]
MNDVLSTLQSHRSDREFLTDPVGERQLEQILDCGRRAANWHNGQQVTAIVVRDPQRKARLAKLCAGQQKIEQAPLFIVLIADFHRTAQAAVMRQREQRIQRNMNGVLIGAVDTGIVMGAMMAAARSLGLGVCPIGAIRRAPRDVCRLLALPALTFPMAGLCIGHVARREGPLKPRIDRASFAHMESYAHQHAAGAVADLDRAYRDYSQAMGYGEAKLWSEEISRRYADDSSYADVAAVLREQGFDFN